MSEPISSIVGERYDCSEHQRNLATTHACICANYSLVKIGRTADGNMRRSRPNVCAGFNRMALSTRLLLVATPRRAWSRTGPFRAEAAHRENARSDREERT